MAKFENLAQRLATESKIDIPRKDLFNAAQEWVHQATGIPKQIQSYWPRQPTDIHLHLIMPDASRIDDAELEVLNRLQGEKLRVDIWEAQVDLDHKTATGQLAMREIRLPETSKRHFHILNDRRSTELLSQMAYQNMALHNATPSWDSYGNDESQTLRVLLPIGDEDCNGPHFKICATDDEIRFRADLGVPGHLNSKYSLTELKTDILPMAMGAVRNWIAQVFPPDPNTHDEAARQLKNFNHSSKTWSDNFTLPNTEITVRATGSHTGTLRRSDLTLHLAELDDPLPLETIAELSNHLFEAFIRQLIAEGAHSVGWTIPQAPR